MNAPLVHTWADGFGIWHARILQPADDRTSAQRKRQARDVARRAILDELEQRSGPSFARSAVRIRWTMQTEIADGCTATEFAEAL